MTNSRTVSRPVSIPHLVFGLVFLGAAGVWGIGEATNADLPHTAVGFPAVLILAGIIGLAASVLGTRSHRVTVTTAPEMTETTPIHETTEDLS